MTIEVRPIERSEAEDYLRVLPFVNGLPMWEPAPAAWHWGSAAWPARPPVSAQRLAELVDETTGPGIHPQAAFVDGELVGGSAMLPLLVTVPGSTAVPMGGVTATGVIATHRRRGLLRLMMQAMFGEALERGEALAGLSASEGSIYGRFGFSPATTRTRWELERSEAALRDADPPTGSLELTDAATARKEWPRIHEQVRRRRVGEITPQPGQWARLTDEADGTNGPLHYLIHRDPTGQVDGIANYLIPWSPTEVGTLAVVAIETLSPDAYRAMWTLLTDYDLMRRTVAASRPADEPLRWMLRNPRAMRVTRQADNLWLRILDLPRALAARAYESSASLAIAVDADPMCPHNVGVWQLDASPAGATCSPTRTAPDLTVDVQALGSLYLGGMSAALLAGAGRIREHRAGAVAELGRLLRTDPAPFNALGF